MRSDGSDFATLGAGDATPLPWPLIWKDKAGGRGRSLSVLKPPGLTFAGDGCGDHDEPPPSTCVCKGAGVTVEGRDDMLVTFVTVSVPDLLRGDTRIIDVTGAAAPAARGEVEPINMTLRCAVGVGFCIEGVIGTPEACNR